MKSARIIVLAIALIAGGLAAYLVSGYSDNRPTATPVAQLPTVDVLVAKDDISLGQTVTPENLLWQTWTQSSASASFIRRSERPEAATQLAGSIARAPFISGEPIREQKLVKANGSGFMAAILPTGMRALSTEISAETGAGGFILPNDRVDVILTKREHAPPNPDGSASADIITSQVILASIRVLAIDQAPKEKDGQNAVVGKTATLEVTPDDAETLTRARQSGTLSLALRSIVDGKISNNVVAAADNRLITVYRGVTIRESLSCNPWCERR
jgi:pilus assembly protein CpaB